MWRISFMGVPFGRRVAPGTAASIAFFMTLGKASPGSDSREAHQHSGGGRRRDDTCARKTSSSRRKCVKTWTMGRSRRSHSARKGASSSASRHAEDRELGQPFGARHLGHAAEEPVVVAAAEQDRAVLAHGHEGGADPGRAFRLRCPDRKELLASAGVRGAAVGERAERAGRPLRRAEAGAEVHHRLGVVAGALARRQPRLMLRE